MQLPETAVETLHTVIDTLSSHGYTAMIVGGVATFAWGDPRTTRDLDIAVHAFDDEMDAIEAALEATGTPPDGPFSTAFGHRFILPFESGLPVDVFLDDRGSLFERCRFVSVGDVELPVKAPEDVVLEKLANARRFPEERERDLEDAAGIVYKQAGTFDLSYARERCRILDVCDLLEAVLEGTDDGPDDGRDTDHNPTSSP